MGECHCSNIAIMQLFHELKQQFPALPDHVVSQCIAQNSHDRETCARRLRATQDARPSPGAFPPPAPVPAQPTPCAMNSNSSRAHRPASLDIGLTRRCPVTCPRVPIQHPSHVAPSSAPAACPARGFFDDLNTPNHAGFELNVNVACSPASNRDFRTVPPSTGKRSDLVVEPRPHYADPLAANVSNGPNGTPVVDHTRSYTSVSLTLRPPSSEPQPPIDIRSQGSSLTYSTSSVDPRGFQSRLQISIGPGNVGSVAAARIRPPMGPTRPTTLLTPQQTTPHRPPGLPAGPPSQLPRPTTTMSAPTTTMSAPTTPSVPQVGNVPVAPSSLPTTPSAPSTPPPLAPRATTNNASSSTTAEPARSPLNQVAERQRRLVEEQLVRRDRLASELRAEKGRLEAMKRELESLARPLDSTLPPQELKRKLRSEIYQLQVECDRLADEVDQRSDPRVPLGETNEEFYQGIYTGQPFVPVPFNASPPPLPSQPPAWEPAPSRNTIPNVNIDPDRDDRDGPSWVCKMCTFDNHPLMDKCEQCDMPRLLNHNTGETQDIHIRVTHHHNFSPRRTVHSWVV
ncbi:TGF-beta-activated kinase 1 and MAP3K7-binding protein 2 isoform X2 [Cephus cinctus]|uniref:TGF-beta-activated kinase 1 and MAP3K7-binding protein 2 isoform X2 n=1 Tax=Cephus cinctus TaxID=211228 RepID=A0AAJ7C1H0_CEPCN|nr:TGF-beta-activated kinase 1 and MAP3K7-binding protein 2 isoform X2 [Cephus cinctus]